MTKKKTIEERLRRDGYIDNGWCLDTKLTNRLSGYIQVLEAEGWVFDAERSGFLPGTKNWRYYLADAPRTHEKPKVEGIIVEGPGGPVYRV